MFTPDELEALKAFHAENQEKQLDSFNGYLNAGDLGIKLFNQFANVHWLQNAALCYQSANLVQHARACELMLQELGA